jgi:hypothetical protein
MLDATGEGVLSTDDDWYPEPVGLSPLALKEAAEVSARATVSKSGRGGGKEAVHHIRLLDASAVE